VDAEVVKLKRPGTENKSEDQKLESKAFNTFIRRGREALNPDEAKSLRVSDDTAGGYIAPDEFVAELDRNVVLFSPVRQVARVRPTGAGAVLTPKRTGGMTAAWVGETSARPETTVTFGQNRFPVCELAAYVDVSNAMLEDSAFDIASLLAFEFAEEFGVAEGTAFVNGASVLSPTGFMQDAGLSYTPGTDASAIKADGLIDLYHAIKAPYRGNAVWGMNATTLGTIRKLKDGNSNYLVAVAGINNAPVSTLLGRPIVEMPDMPNIGAGTFPVIFGDFSQGYSIFDRIALSILRDPYSQATNGMTRFHGRRRVAAGVAKAEAIRKLKIATS
jgi:HK97 family phage major capsid protein